MDKDLRDLLQTLREHAEKYVAVVSVRDWSSAEFLKEGGDTSDDGLLSAFDDMDEDDRLGSVSTKSGKNYKNYKRVENSFELEYMMVMNSLKTRNTIIKESKGFHMDPAVIAYVDLCEILSATHLDRADNYQKTITIEDIDDDMQEYQIKFMQKVSEGAIKVTLEKRKGKLETDFDSDDLNLHENTPIANLFMIDQILSDNKELKDKLDEMGVDLKSTPKDEFHIHNPNPPVWNRRAHFFDQEPEVLQYYVDERKKMQRGIVVGGVYFQPWMYFHMNYFKTPIPVAIKHRGSDQTKPEDKIMVPAIRDNEWLIIQDAYTQAEKESKMLFISASRRLAKSTLIASHIHWKLITIGGQLIVAGGDTKDLGQIMKYLRISLNNVEPVFGVSILERNWEKQVVFGLRTKQNHKTEFAYLEIINLLGGAESKSEALAGFTPNAFVIDEAMKVSFINQLRGAKPSFHSSFGMRCTPILSGCLTAGNKVFTKEGNYIKIEDLKQHEGIVGYNKDKQSVSIEDITHINPPQSKECVLIETKSGSKIECSNDHPFLVKSRNTTEMYVDSYGKNKKRRRLEWVEAIDLSSEHQLVLPKYNPLLGTRRMKDPYFIGLLIGDGNYSGDRGARLSNEDSEIWEYVDSIGKDYKITKEYTTKLGRQYKEVTFRGGMKFLKELGIYGQKGKTKDLPDDIHTYNEYDVIEMLSGLYDADGWPTMDSKGNNKGIRLASISELMIDNVKSVLLRLGIHSTKQFIKPDNRDRKIKSKQGYFILGIHRKSSVETFHEKIGFKVKRKQEKLDECVRQFNQEKGRDDKSYPNNFFDTVKIVTPVGRKPVYNLTTSTTHTYLANGFVTHNTGGNDALSKDAYQVLSDPAIDDILEMNWDHLNDHVPPEHRTWKERRFGTFAPAQMSQRDHMIKLESNLADYLKIDNKELRKIKLLVTDWERCNRIIRDYRDSIMRNREAWRKEVVYYPISPEEIFMSGTESPFPTEDAKLHYERMIEQNNLGRRVDIVQIDGKVEFIDSNKEMPVFPHPGGQIDAPVVLYDTIPENPPIHLYISSLDDYKQEDSASSSLGSFYVFKRQSGNDPMGDRIVASYTSRPNPHRKFHRWGHALIKTHNAMCLMENEDMEFKIFLDEMKETDRWLVPTFNLQGNLTVVSNARRTYGISPRGNKKAIINAVAKYCNEPVTIPDGKGGTIETIGVYRIPDHLLVKEIMDYSDNLNVDRIVAFGIALIQAHYLDTRYIPAPAQKKKVMDIGKAPVNTKNITSVYRVGKNSRKRRGIIGR